MSKNCIVPIALAALLGAGCGASDDSSSGGEVESFCQILRDADAADGTDAEVDLSEDFEAGMAQMQDFRAAAPSELRGDIDTMIGVFEKMDELESTGLDEEEMFGAVFALILDPTFIAASESLEKFGVEECGLEPTDDDGFDLSSDGDDPIDISDDGLASDGSIPEGFITEPADVEDPLWGDFGSDDPFDPAIGSIDGAQYFLDSNYPDAPWRTRLGSWSSGSINGSFSLDAGGTSITADEAQEICAALVEYLAPLEPGGQIEISTYTQDEDGQTSPFDLVLAGSVADGC